MMISASSYAISMKNKSYQELIIEKNRLIKEINEYENRDKKKTSLINKDPSPEVVYLQELNYLKVLLDLIEERYKRETSDEKPNLFVYVSFVVGEKEYCYKTNKEIPERGFALVPVREDEEAIVRIEKIKSLYKDEEPYPYEDLKEIKKIISPIRLTKKNLKEIKEDDILFVSIAEGGAMGCPGEVEIITKKSGYYTCNPLMDEIKYSDIAKIFKPLKGLSLGPTGVSNLDYNWSDLPLGYGNHLILRRELYNPITLAAEDKNILTPPSLYANWKLLAFNYLLNNK